MQVSSDEYRQAIHRIADCASAKYNDLPTAPVHPAPENLDHAQRQIYQTLPDHGLQLQDTVQHLLADICPGLSNSPSPRYYGFVTGGSTPAAQLADLLSSIHDQNVQVHLPACSISTSVEDAALRMIMQLLKMDGEAWPGRTITTGATASNLLGLACGRNDVLGKLGVNVGEDGFAGKTVKLYCASAHASIKKAASIVGIGRSNCIEVTDGEDIYGISFDLDRLEVELVRNKDHGIGSIIVVSMGEVNTGLTTPRIPEIKKLARQYDAWIHADAAFAIFAGIHPDLSNLLSDLQYADSICVDGHKWLNVPYDAAMFYTSNKAILKDVCASGPAAYLTSSTSFDAAIESPLNVGIENSRRFRALPLYATLVAYGQGGYELMIRRNIDFARSIDAYFRQSDFFEVLTPRPAAQIGDHLKSRQHETTNIVLFSIKPEIARFVDMPDVVGQINAERQLYVTGTVFRGRSAARVAVSNWRTGLCRNENVLSHHRDTSTDEDLKIVTTALDSVVQFFLTRN